MLLLSCFAVFPQNPHALGILMHSSFPEADGCDSGLILGQYPYSLPSKRVLGFLFFKFFVTNSPVPAASAPYQGSLVLYRLCSDPLLWGSSDHLVYVHPCLVAQLPSCFYNLKLSTAEGLVPWRRSFPKLLHSFWEQC
ncbi:hypothetical protein QAD02_002380 [Eretmocerus hayati]|uniref:Uncharacterized protein n=1 Tax=Eretmocerus hayati TaxID=131215 RepID=A0ACC2NJ53_9HYME|nr:hypothetical protein QAD02_002380 [Eretmocerus hayati]